MRTTSRTTQSARFTGPTSKHPQVFRRSCCDVPGVYAYARTIRRRFFRRTLALTCRQQAAKPAVDGQVHRVVGRLLRVVLARSVHSARLAQVTGVLTSLEQTLRDRRILFLRPLAQRSLLSAPVPRYRASWLPQPSQLPLS